MALNIPTLPVHKFRQKLVIASAVNLLYCVGLVTIVAQASQHESSIKPTKSEKKTAGGVDLNTHREDLADEKLPEHLYQPLFENDGLPPSVATFKNALMIVGPSASGKTTLANRLMDDLGDQIYMLARHTSRAPRPHEVNGTDYVFVTRQDILGRLKNGEFITISELADNIYGISKAALRDCIRASTREGKLCMTEMMVSAMVLDAMHMVPELNGVFVFIRTPNITVMEQRLRGRNTETDDAILSRVHQAKADMSFCDNKRHLIDYCLTNNDLEYTYRRMKDIVRAEFPFITFPGDDEFNAPADDEDEGYGDEHEASPVDEAKLREKVDVKVLKAAENVSKKEAKRSEKKKKSDGKIEL